MAAPSSDWIAGQQAAERAMVERFADLTEVLLREDRRLAALETRISALRTMPNAAPALLERELRDRRQLVAIAAHHLANLDRVHLLEEPARRKRAGSGR